MTTTLFYTTNAAVLIGCLLTAWGIFFHGRQFNGDLHLLRRFVAAVFTVLAIHRISLFTIVRPEGVEVYASQPIVLLCIAFIVLAMGGCAVMGRRHHLNFALWVLMLLIPFVFILVNSIMMASGLYRPLFHWSEILDFRVSTPMIYYGRVLFVAFLLVFWLLAVCMLVDAYFYDRNRRIGRPLSEDAERHDGEVRFVFGWAVLIIICFVPLCIPCLIPHIIFDIVLIGALIVTALGYRRLVRYLRAKDNGRLAPVLIARRIPLLLSMERGGITAWGTMIQQNPFFNGNPMLDDVAQALGVHSSEVSEYVQTLNTNFVAWVSDQRLRHCAAELTHTNRKIIEIAISCGYNDLPTFTRAFKRQFGVAPSEYRKQEQLASE